MPQPNNGNLPCSNQTSHQHNHNHNHNQNHHNNQHHSSIYMNSSSGQNGGSYGAGSYNIKHAHALNNYHYNNSNNYPSNNNIYSPSATLTPGRKSASPTFFHSTHFNNPYNNHTGVNSHHHSLHHSNHQPSGFVHGHNDGGSLYGSPNVYSFNYPNNSNHHHLNSNNNNHQALGPSLSHTVNHDSASLRIPTTPTRSKSLSPQFRNVMQPARLRLKQQNQANGGGTVASSLSKRNDKHISEGGESANAFFASAKSPLNKNRFSFEPIKNASNNQLKPSPLARDSNNSNEQSNPDKGEDNKTARSSKLSSSTKKPESKTEPPIIVANSHNEIVNRAQLKRPTPISAFEKVLTQKSVVVPSAPIVCVVENPTVKDCELKPAAVSENLSKTIKFVKILSIF